MTRMLLHSAALCVWVAAFGCMLLAVTAVALWAFSQEGPSQIRWVLLNLTIVPVVGFPGWQQANDHTSRP